MTKEQKTEAVEQITAWLEEFPAIYLTDYSGLTVEKTNELRGKFREAEVDYRVLKNTLIRLAMERVGGYDDVIPFLKGPTAVAFTNEPAAPARVIRDFLKDNEDLEKPAFRAALVDGAMFTSEQFEVLAALKSKDELIADIIGLLLSPMTNVVGALQAQGGNLVGAIKTIAEKGDG